MEPQEKLSAKQEEKLSAKQDKNQAWEMGLSGVEEDVFFAWIEDKYVLPHHVKLSTLFFDAKNNTRVLVEYTQATSKILSVDLKKYKGKNFGVRGATKTKLLELINAVDVDLPEKLDIPDSSILKARPVGAGTSKEQRVRNRVLVKQQQKVYVRILNGAARLCDYVLSMVASGDKGDKMVMLEVGTLISLNIFVTLRGFNNGVCHKLLSMQLRDKVTGMTVIEM